MRARKKVILWFLVSISLGVGFKDMKNRFGARVARNLPYLAEQYLAKRFGAENILTKHEYDADMEIDEVVSRITR